MAGIGTNSVYDNFTLTGNSFIAQYFSGEGVGLSAIAVHIGSLGESDPRISVFVTHNLLFLWHEGSTSDGYGKLVGFVHNVGESVCFLDKLAFWPLSEFTEVECDVTHLVITDISFKFPQVEDGPFANQIATKLGCLCLINHLCAGERRE